MAHGNGKSSGANSKTSGLPLFAKEDGSAKAGSFPASRKVFVEGRLQVRTWEGQDGQKRTSVEIRFARVISLERRDPGEAFGIGLTASRLA